MPFKEIGKFQHTGGVQKFHDFKRPVTFYDRVRFVGADSSVEILGGVLSGDITLSGDLVSSAWNGAATLALPDATATAGYALDDSAGKAQFQVLYAGDGAITGDFVVEGTFSTAASGERMEILDTTSSATSIRWYTGLAGETSSARMYTGSGTFPHDSGNLYLRGPIFGGVTNYTTAYLSLGSQDSTPATGSVSLGAFAEGDAEATVSIFAKGDFSDDADITSLYETTAYGTGYASFTIMASSEDGDGDLKLLATSSGTGTPNINMTADYINGYAAQFRGPAGSTASPGISFHTDTDTGMYRPSSNVLEFSTGGNSRLSLGGTYVQLKDASGNTKFWVASTAIYANGTNHYFRDGSSNVLFRITYSGNQSRLLDSTGGNIIALDKSLDQFLVYLNSGLEMTLGTTGFVVPNVYNATTGSAANINVASGGSIRRSTSTAEWKQDIKPWKGSGVLDLTPVTFYPMTGIPPNMKREGSRKLLGLTYEDALEHFPKAAIKNDKALDWNAITTALIGEVAALKEQLEILTDVCYTRHTSN